MDAAELLSLPDQICFWPRWLLRLYGFINIPAFLQQSLRRLKEELWLQPSWVCSIGHEQAGAVTQLPDRSVKVLWQLYDTKRVEITNITEFMPIYDMLSVALSCLPSVALAWLGFLSLPFPSSIYLQVTPYWCRLSQGLWNAWVQLQRVLLGLVILEKNFLSRQKPRKINCTFRVLIILFLTVKQ